MSLRQTLPILLMIIALGLSAPACQFAIGNTSMWLRPTRSIAPRTVENGDGEKIYMEGYTPRGDSMFLVLRFYPGGEVNQSKVTNSKLKNWPEKIKERAQKNAQESSK